jgi:hypothetical protein
MPCRRTGDKILAAVITTRDNGVIKQGIRQSSEVLKASSCSSFERPDKTTQEGKKMP